MWSSLCTSCTTSADLGCLERSPAELSLRGCVLQCLQGSRVKEVINCHRRNVCDEEERL